MEAKNKRYKVYWATSSQESPDLVMGHLDVEAESDPEAREKCRLTIQERYAHIGFYFHVEITYVQWIR